MKLKVGDIIISKHNKGVKSFIIKDAKYKVLRVVGINKVIIRPICNFGSRSCRGTWRMSNFYSRVKYTRLAEKMFPKGRKDGIWWHL